MPVTDLILSRLRGTRRALFSVFDVLLKRESSTALGVRNALDAAYINVRGADPVIADDLVTYRVMPRVASGTVDFGFASGLEGDVATVTVPATWVTAGSKIVCVPAGGTTADHEPEDAVIEGIVANATNLVAGVSFDIEACAPQGTWGRYVINAVGL